MGVLTAGAIENPPGAGLCVCMIWAGHMNQCGTVFVLTLQPLACNRQLLSV